MASARVHGRFSRVYVAIASSGSVSAEPVPFITTWAFNNAVDYVEVTALGDTAKVRVAGLPDNSGTYAGFYDTGTAQLFTAASDGIARKTYLYPDIVGASGQYWWGTAFWDFSFSTGVSDADAISGNFTAATPFTKVG